MVVILSKTSEEGALIAAERIRAGIRLHAKHVGIELDASIGIAIYPSHGTSEEELIRVADLAMYVAKASGDKMRIGFEEYTVTEQCVTLVYQPIWHVDSRTVVGHEVFSRDPRGDLSPAGLFQKYRAAGQLRRLKRLIFGLQIREARQAGIGRIFLNVDLEFLSGTEPPLIPQGLEAVVELSELDSSSPPEQRLAVALKWRQAGYRIALDDFGAGYASLSVLAELRPDYIKVDRSCIARATASEQYREFLRHLVQSAAVMASGGVIAEGIEQVSELEVVRALGIPLAQGFLLGRPRPVPVTGVACDWPETSHASIDS
jgi:EAL domain-containing protein (putative c-di-GMP-specific phosphodiesterase class I)